MLVILAHSELTNNGRRSCRATATELARFLTNDRTARQKATSEFIQMESEEEASSEGTAPLIWLTSE